MIPLLARLTHVRPACWGPGLGFCVVLPTTQTSWNWTEIPWGQAGLVPLPDSLWATCVNSLRWSWPHNAAPCACLSGLLGEARGVMAGMALQRLSQSAVMGGEWQQGPVTLLVGQLGVFAGNLF